MPATRPVIAAVVATLAAASAAAVAAPAAASADPAYTVTTLHFAVTTGPANDTPCDIVGDLYLPNDASSAHRVPAILTTNGFGGSKDDQAGIGAAFAGRDYAVLSYSGLGFGGSGCKITLDHPAYDGKAGSQLISYLGGAPGIAYTDAAHTTPAPALTVIKHDAIDHARVRQTYDPRVGMIGGSYGGEIQFSITGQDPRVDTIIPLITWNDLAYSLDPNNTAQTAGVSTSTPGAVKLAWGLGFSAEGVADGLQNSQADPSRLYGCPNFANFVCPALVTAGTTGYFQPADVAAMQHASVASYMSHIRVPVLLMQGENDTLFNLNEAAATFKALKQQHTTVKMVWQSWGHSHAAPAPGELSLSNPDPATQYETARIVNWFDHYLAGTSADTGPAFAYFRDWIGYSGIATPAYATSTSYPVGTASRLYLSGDQSLNPTRSAVQNGTRTFATPPAGVPTALDPADVVGSYAPISIPDLDLPGTYASWITAPLATPLTVAGSPTLTVTVSAPAAALTQGLGPAGQLVLFVKLADVGPGLDEHLINGGIAPIRVPDVTKPIKISIPALVHQFPAGHHLKLTISGGSVNYRGGLVPTPVSIAGGTGQLLSLPTV